MKVASGVNFINVLLTAFALVDPKSVKNAVESSVSFMLLGSTSVKSEHRTLMKLSPGVNFVNILRAALTPTDPKSRKTPVKLSFFFVI